MSGFYDSDKMKKIEEKDEQHEKLRHKIKRQTFREREHPAWSADEPKDDEPMTQDAEEDADQGPLKDITSSLKDLIIQKVME